MYKDIKLEKGMYHLAGKSFLQALEEADPSAQYAGTPLARLDAFERQLKRFDIRVSGAGCDRVEKFFTTTESAVLFPEFIRRAVLQGMQESVLGDMAATVTRCESNRYQGLDLVEIAAYSTTNQAATMPASSILEASTALSLAKYGRVVNASYEAVRHQNLDIFALMLRRVGRELASSVVSAAVTVLKTGSASINKSGSVIAYSDLAALYGHFTTFRMTTVLASPAVTAKILSMTEMQEASSEDVSQIRLPFGTKLINCPQVDDNTVIGLDADFALEQVQSSDVVLETDKLIDCQLDSIGISVNIGFRKLISGAVYLLNLS